MFSHTLNIVQIGNFPLQCIFPTKSPVSACSLERHHAVTDDSPETCLCKLAVADQLDTCEVGSHICPNGRTLGLFPGVWGTF